MFWQFKMFIEQGKEVLPIDWMAAFESDSTSAPNLTLVTTKTRLLSEMGVHVFGTPICRELLHDARSQVLIFIILKK